MSTELMPCADLRRWNVIASRTFGDIAVESRAGSFVGALAVRDFGRLRVVDVHSSPARVSGGSARRPGWFLLYGRSGACVLQQGARTARIDAGELSLLRADHPFEIRFAQPNRMCVVGLPALEVPAALGEHVALRHGRHEARVLGTLLDRLQALGPEAARRTDPGVLQRAFVELLQLALPEPDEALPAPPAGRRQALLQRLDELVAQQLADPELDAAALGRALGVSGRHVQALFAAQGTTLGAVLMERRLRLAARLLREQDARISEVALQAGFGDLSHFCRSFRRRFGCTAGHWRAGG